MYDHHYLQFDYIPNRLNRRRIHKKMHIQLKLKLPIVLVVHFDFSAPWLMCLLFFVVVIALKVSRIYALNSHF